MNAVAKIRRHSIILKYEKRVVGCVLFQNIGVLFVLNKLKSHLGVDGRIMLKLIFKKWDEEVCPGLL
jgi:hypothetical protein